MAAMLALHSSQFVFSRKPCGGLLGVAFFFKQNKLLSLGQEVTITFFILRSISMHGIAETEPDDVQPGS